jgi:hypothetical protein
MADKISNAAKIIQETLEAQGQAVWRKVFGSEMNPLAQEVLPAAAISFPTFFHEGGTECEPEWEAVILIQVVDKVRKKDALAAVCSMVGQIEAMIGQLPHDGTLGGHVDKLRAMPWFEATSADVQRCGASCTMSFHTVGTLLTGD